MIVGTGMLARAFVPLAKRQGERLCVYAYGVSNSSCIDPVAFMREAIALKESLERQRDAIFLYFGTCSVDDPEMQQSPYVLHKLRMEAMVAEYGNGIVVRLPQVAGSTHNPATLLNFLANHLINGTPFDLWIKARRNIIDVGDVVLIVEQMLADKKFQGRVVNIANPINYSMPEIVSTMEDILGRKAVYRQIDKGSVYAIDITSAIAWMDAAGVRINQDYLANVIIRYYSRIRANVATSR